MKKRQVKRKAKRKTKRRTTKKDPAVEKQRAIKIKSAKLERNYNDSAITWAINACIQLDVIQRVYARHKFEKSTLEKLIEHFNEAEQLIKALKKSVREQIKELAQNDKETNKRRSV